METIDTKEKLKKRIEEIIENNDYIYRETIIPDIINALIDYQNETQDYKLENYTRTFENYDSIEQYVKDQINEMGLERIPYLIGDTRFDYDYYKINAYWNLENIQYGDIENRIGDILDEL